PVGLHLAESGPALDEHHGAVLLFGLAEDHPGHRRGPEHHRHRPADGGRGIWPPLLVRSVLIGWVPWEALWRACHEEWAGWRGRGQQWAGWRGRGQQSAIWPAGTASSRG